MAGLSGANKRAPPLDVRSTEGLGRPVENAAILWQPHGTTPCGASDGWRLTRPATPGAAILRRANDEVRRCNGLALTVIRLLVLMLLLDNMVRVEEPTAYRLGLACSSTARARRRCFRANLARTTDGALAEGRTAQPDDGESLLANNERCAGRRRTDGPGRPPAKAMQPLLHENERKTLNAFAEAA